MNINISVIAYTLTHSSDRIGLDLSIDEGINGNGY